MKLSCVLTHLNLSPNCIVRVNRLRTTRATGRVACMGFGWNGFQDVLTRTLTMEVAPPCQRYLSTPECKRFQYPDDYCLSSTRRDNPTVNTDSCRLLETDIFLRLGVEFLYQKSFCLMVYFPHSYWHISETNLTFA
jgi:hypothetical protein